MKKFSKILSVALLVALVLSLGVTSAFAGTIEVKNVIDDEEYTAYKILNYTTNGTSYSYYLTAAEYESIGSVLETAGFSFTASSDGSQYFVDNSDTLNDSGVSDVAEYLGAHIADLGNALGKYEATGEDGSAVFEDLPTGYFFVTSSAGSLCALHEDTDIATAVEKNTIPTIEKKEQIAKGEIDPKDYVEGPINGNINDVVNYQIVVTDGVGTDAELTVTDTLSTGLTYKAGSLKINGTAVADDANVTNSYVVTVDGQVITIVFAPAFVKDLGTGETITITLDATINENALINTGNENKVELDYSNQHSEDTVEVKTYDFIVYKTDGTAFLDGAEFKLYTEATGGTQILLSVDDKGYYVDPNGDAATTIDINSAAGCNVRGLAPGTYYLEEVVVPDGYNKLDARESVTVVENQTAAVEITVVNNQGARLPSTGGIGTTIFYVVGGILVVAAGVLLITKKRMSE